MKNSSRYTHTLSLPRNTKGKITSCYYSLSTNKDNLTKSQFFLS